LTRGNERTDGRNVRAIKESDLHPFAHVFIPLNLKGLWENLDILDPEARDIRL
jgi:hypothetical protein